jgi:hypothetical protein
MLLWKGLPGKTLEMGLMSGESSQGAIGLLDRCIPEMTMAGTYRNEKATGGRDRGGGGGEEAEATAERSFSGQRTQSEEVDWRVLIGDGQASLGDAA